MRAVVQKRYGPPAEVFALEEVARPTPGPGEVLVAVRAVAINISDALMTDAMLPIRVMSGRGLARPKVTIPGKDIAGVVEAVGPGVTELKPGDEVIGPGTMALAEYARVPADRLVAKPADLTFPQAAALIESAMTALQGIRDHGAVKAGERVLINGSSGGVGVYAVQIAKALGAEVTGVCGTGNAGLVGDLGADHVIDYTRRDFTAGEARYDVILDNVGNHSPEACCRVLAPDGRLLLNGGGISMGRGDGLWRGLIGPILQARRLGQPGIMPIEKWRAEDQLELLRMVDEGCLRPVIDRTLPMERAAEGFEAAASGRARGKIVVTVP